MIVIFLLIALVALIASLAVPGLGDLVMLAGPVVLACLYLMWRAPKRRKAAPEPPQKLIVVDGSNVMHWRNNTADIATLVAVINRLRAKHYAPCVVFDANAGYKIANRYHGDAAMARLLDLPADRVLVVPKGVIADHYVLTAARHLTAPVVTNDLYRDWTDEFPEVATPGHLIRGGFRDGALWMEGV
jgi:hypothetical protein